ncbi:hypothetical protein E1165_01445 [Micromonospora sp. KC723]|nr:hypothetical protein E1165_01445 [Micromonospora sp. KC723]
MSNVPKPADSSRTSPTERPADATPRTCSTWSTECAGLGVDQPHADWRARASRPMPAASERGAVRPGSDAWKPEVPVIAYQEAVRLFCSYLVDPAYGSADECQQRFGTNCRNLAR